jgi:hypothetical protein
MRPPITVIVMVTITRMPETVAAVVRKVKSMTAIMKIMLSNLVTKTEEAEERYWMQMMVAVSCPGKLLNCRGRPNGLPPSETQIRRQYS